MSCSSPSPGAASFQANVVPKSQSPHWRGSTPSEPPNVATALKSHGPLPTKSCWIMTSYFQSSNQLSYMAQALVPEVCGIDSDSVPIMAGKDDNDCSSYGAPSSGTW